MNTPATTTAIFDRGLASWNRFWFTPRDPTLLGVIRIGTALITLYTLFTYCFDLQAFFGEHAWLDLETRMDVVRNTPIMIGPLRGQESPLSYPSTLQQKRYLDDYLNEFKVLPPGPYPTNDEEQAYCLQFMRRFHFDLRKYGLAPPQDLKEKQYVEEFARKFHDAPAPPYPATEKESLDIDRYYLDYGSDPRRLLAKGRRVFSFWFHVTDPTEMALLHATVMGVTFLFLIGFCTRLTSALTWFASVCYIHRQPVIMFGTDTMQNILLLYLMIGPSGAALSVDRLINRWWREHKLDVLNKWRRITGRGPLLATEINAAHFDAVPQPSVGANFALRLLQVHLCIIYLAAGLAKLLGNSWWTGTAVWGTIANFEFAPMNWSFYNEALRFIGHNSLVFNAFLTIGTYFTLVFEISYAFLIWRPTFRWPLLWAAMFLHGFIGLLMGLRTFGMIMVVMNMGFLLDSEAHRLVNFVRKLFGVR